MRTTLTLLIAFLFIPNGKSQNLDIARSLEKDFPQADVGLIESSTEINFKKRKNGEWWAIVKMYDNYIALNKSIEHDHVIYYDEYSEIKDLDVRAQTIERAYNSEGIFHNDAKLKISELRFKKYAQTHEVRVTKIFKNLKYLSTFYLNTSVPSLTRSVTLNIPSDLDGTVFPFNFEDYEVDVTEERNKKNRVLRYEVKNTSGYFRGSGLPGPSHIYPHIIINVQSSSGSNHPSFTSIKDQYNWYKYLVENINNDPTQIKPIVDELIEGCSDPKEKIEKIYYWVQDNIRYLAFEDGIAGFQPESCQDVYSKKYGDCKGKANLTKEMLQLAGFDARLVWMGTRDLAYDYSFPSLSIDNHMICAVEKDNKFLYLDPTEVFLNIDDIAERIQGRPVLIEDKNNFIIDSISSRGSEQNTRNSLFQFSMNEEGKLIGNGRMEISGEIKSQFLYSLNGSTSDERLNVKDGYLTQWDVRSRTSNVDLNGPDQLSKTTVLTGDIELVDAVRDFGNETFVTLDIFNSFDQYLIKEDREVDYWFDYKLLNNLQIELALPEGKTVQSLPEAIKFSNDNLSVKGTYELEDGKIVYRLTCEVRNSRIERSSFSQWNEHIRALQEFYDQPVILK